jgi:hypothetical protein
VNVQDNPEAQARVRAKGYLSAVVCRGDECVSVVNLRGIAKLVGIAYQERRMLSPEVLLQKYLVVLDACCRYCRQAPIEHLTHSQVDRPNRTFRSLGIHAIQMAAAFLDSIDTGRVNLQGRPLPEGAAEGWTGPDIAAYGVTIRQELEEWWATTGKGLAMDQPIENNWGITTLHATMERQTWHSAQHTRQLIMFLDQLGIEPDGRLTAEDLAGLPLPDNVWT